jgi:hypothetical protein
VGGRQWSGPQGGGQNAKRKHGARKRKQKANAKSNRGAEPDDGRLPWRQWYTTWSQTNRSYEEFWELSPAQVGAVFEGMGFMKQKSGSSDIMQFATKMGLPVNKV